MVVTLVDVVVGLPLLAELVVPLWLAVAVEAEVVVQVLVVRLEKVLDPVV